MLFIKKVNLIPYEIAWRKTFAKFQSLILCFHLTESINFVINLI